MCWELESLTITDAEASALEHFRATVYFTGERYRVSLPWKWSCQSLPRNYNLCQQHLFGLLQCLRHNPEMLEEYNSIIQSQLCQGNVEFVYNLVSTNNMRTTETARQIHYLPHHAVIRQQKRQLKSELCMMPQHGVGTLLE